MNFEELRSMLSEYAKLTKELQSTTENLKIITNKLIFEEINLDNIPHDLLQNVKLKKALEDKATEIKARLSELSSQILSTARRIGLPNHIVFRLGNTRFILLHDSLRVEEVS